MHKLIFLLMALFAFALPLTHAAENCFFAPGYAPPVHEAKTALSNYLKTCNDKNTPRVPLKMANGDESWGCTDDFAVFERAAIRICPADGYKKPRIQWTCEEIRFTGERLIEKCQKDGLVGGRMDLKDPVRGYMKIAWNWKKPFPQR